jgi:adenine-specific DNA-methyltransferase
MPRRGPGGTADGRGRSVIKYLGSKRLLVPVLGDILDAVGARSALDLFTGTTRVAREFKRRGATVTAVDSATYAEILARCYIGSDATVVDPDDLGLALHRLNGLPGRRGYVTEVFCERARYFQPFNGERIDAIRDHIQDHYGDSPLYPILLTSLMLAADRVDSTTGVHMAYLKGWAPRSFRSMELRIPDLIPGGGRALRGDAVHLVDTLPPVDLAYLDPPYNQHRYFTNYHIWETLVRWDSPEYYGVACKRIDARDEATRSVFNSKRLMPQALRSIIHRVQATTVVVSYNDESWVGAEDLMAWLREAGHEDVRLLAFDSKRYVGAQIGIFNRSGERVGTVGHLRNTEYVFVAGPAELVDAAARAACPARAD